MAKLTTLCFGMAVLGCGCSDTPLEPTLDTTPPSVDILFPAAQADYDRDGDRLVEFVALVTDSGSGIAGLTFEVRSLRTPTAAETNLLPQMSIEFAGDTVVIGESRDSPLQFGFSNFEIVAIDSAGNRGSDTVAVTLRAGEFLGTIDTRLTAGLPGDGLVYCPDDNLIYMTAITSLVVVEPDGPSLVSVISANPPDQPEQRATWMRNLTCVPGDPVIYIGDARITRYDRSAQRWISPFSDFPEFSDGNSLLPSRVDPNFIYITESFRGTVGRIDRRNATIERDLFFVGTVQAMALLDGDRKLYAARSNRGGVIVADPRSGTILDSISLVPPSGPWVTGLSLGVSLSPGDTSLYFALAGGPVVPGQVVEIDTRTDQIKRTLDLTAPAVKVALNPIGDLLFVTTQDQGNIESKNHLVDVHTWSIVGSFDRPRPAGEIRWDRAVLFSPNGNLIFVIHNVNLDYYLIRKR